MAMKPFCGYNFGDYWKHWLSFGQRSTKLPAIFHVNWFRQDDQGRFLWPGFGDNLRVLQWIIDRCAGRVGARETPIGFLPNPGDIDIDGVDLIPGAMNALLAVEAKNWRDEMASVETYLQEYGTHLPKALLEEHRRVVSALG
jgi:phosphoenolpyruvate carboxykinase (GTP)